MYYLLSFNIKKFCINVCYWWSIFINFFKSDNHEIQKVSLEYNLSDIGVETNNTFWGKEMSYWTKHSHEYWVDITSYYKPDIFENIIKKIPKNIENYILRVKYNFNGKIYTFITRNPTEYVWPPEKPELKFAIPIDKAFILDKFTNQVANVTKKVKKCAGPKFNFHNQKIKVSDIFDYEHAMCQIQFIDGTSKLYKFDDYLN